MPPGAANVRHGYLRVERVGGGFYWLRCDGSVIRRGRDLAEAESFSASFIEAMARLGMPRQSALEIPASTPQSSLSKICA
jgi:hypothetical protein